MPKVSVIVPVYNAGKALIPCLESIAGQTLKDIEVLLILDCPTDGSDKVAKEFSAKDSRFVVIENESNLHVGKSRNRGLEHATGEYIGFCDHDDTMRADMLEIMYGAAKEYGVKFVSSRFYPSDSESIAITLKSVDTEFYSLLQINPNNTVWSHIYEAKFLKQNNIKFVDARNFYAEDLLFNVDVLATCLRQSVSQFADVNLRLYYHDTYGTGGTYEYRKMDNMLNTCDYICSVIDELNYTDLKYNMPAVEAFAYILYRSIRIEIKTLGLAKGFRRLYRLRDFPRVCKVLKSHKALYVPRLTPPKNLFLLLLKCLCR
ncbi:MAG: glycosyltransferase family 2 protein [Bacteroidales bacterium]|nr:glycosyltransferase family 2 protein [Bacteroidales bacterium]